MVDQLGVVDKENEMTRWFLIQREGEWFLVDAYEYFGLNKKVTRTDSSKLLAELLDKVEKGKKK